MRKPSGMLPEGFALAAVAVLVLVLLVVLVLILVLILLIILLLILLVHFQYLHFFLCGIPQWYCNQIIRIYP